MDSGKLMAGMVVLIIVGLFSMIFVDMYNVNHCIISYSTSTRSADEIVKICRRN